MSGKYALIIGNTEYIDTGLAQLTAPGKDAEDFARVLRDKEISAFDNVNILLNQSSSTVNETIDEFCDQKKPDDLLVLYFSGHGIRDEFGTLYLGVKNTIRTRLRSTAIKSDYIREAMDQSRSKRQVLILDCCMSGAFAQGTKAATGVSSGTASAFESGYGRIILTASDSTQFAWEGDQVIGETDNSLFTHYLIQGLEGEADLDGDGQITVDELYDYTYEKVRFATPKQTPSKFSSNQQGEIVLRQNIRIEDIKPVSLSDQLVSEIESFYPEIRLRAVSQLAKLLNGKNLGLARSARDALEKISTEDDSRRVAQAATQILEPIRQQELQEKLRTEQIVRDIIRETSRAMEDEIDVIRKEQTQDQIVRTVEVNLSIASEKAEAKEKAERLAAQNAENERLAAEKAEANRKAKEEVDRLVALEREKERKAKEKLESERLHTAREKEELARKNVEIYNRSREAAAKATQAFLSKLKFPALVLVIVVVGYFLWQGISSLIPVTPAATEVPTVGIGSTMIGEKGETLVYVPAGEFTMGSDNGDSDEKPVHKVYLDAFWIDQTEVTNKQYQACVDAGACEPPSSTNSNTHPSYYGNPEFDNYPVVYVSWDKANRYCEVWAGGDLPTEAQWEKAARGTDERTYPWGENIDCDKANYQGSCVSDTSPVRSYESGKSPYNAYDMAGNIWEWVNDYYQSDTYAALGDNASNPQGPTNGNSRVLRGGSWVSSDYVARSAGRFWYAPGITFNVTGFRCARSP